MRNYLKLGDWNARCDSCGRKYKASSLKPRWDGLMVCQDDWETRHPSDFLKVQREKISVPFVRNETDLFIESCNIFNSQGIAGMGIAGCMVAGKRFSGSLT